MATDEALHEERTKSRAMLSYLAIAFVIIWALVCYLGAK